MHPTLDVPLQAHAVSCFIVGLLGLLYLGSTTAFNSMVTACIVLLYISYAIPIACLLIKSRNNIAHGPFWMGGLGLFSNVVLLLWTLFTLIMYSLPPGMPLYAWSKSSQWSTQPDALWMCLGIFHESRLTKLDMNYVSPVYALVVLIIVIDWFVRGRREYRGQAERHEGVVQFRRESVTTIH